MWKLALLLGVLTSSAAVAGESRTSFHVGITITGKPNGPTGTSRPSLSANKPQQTVGQSTQSQPIQPAPPAKTD